MRKEIIDTTLRDGEQAPGLSFSVEERREIALSLMEMGVDEIEAGIPVMGKDVRDFISWLNAEKSGTRVSAWARLKTEDVEEAYKTGSDLIHISMPVSDYHLEAQMGSWKNALLTLHNVLRMAGDLFPRVSLGFQDSFRSDCSRLEEVCAVAEDYRLYRIRFSDTVGSAFPAAVRELISRYRNLFSGKIDFHGHNDLGLAAANSLTALESGADSVSVTVNGIGERAGNASLEQMAFILDLHKDFETGIDLKAIKAISKMVSGYSRRPIAVDRPIIGDLVFTHESGIHCHGLSRNPLAYQPFRPEEKGLTCSSFVAGSHSGKSGVISVLRQAGIDPRDSEMPELLGSVRRKALMKRGYLTTEELLGLYWEKTGRADEHLR